MFVFSSDSRSISFDTRRHEYPAWNPCLEPSGSGIETFVLTGWLKTSRFSTDSMSGLEGFRRVGVILRLLPARDDMVALLVR